MRSKLPKEDPDLNKIMVMNVKAGLREEELKVFFQHMVPGLSEHKINVSIQPATDTDRQVVTGYIQCSDSATADSILVEIEARTEAKENRLHGYTVFVKRYFPQSMYLSDPSNSIQSKTRKIFVANLPKYGFDVEAELRSIFDPLYGKDKNGNPISQLGFIEAYQVVTEKDSNELRGIAFIHCSAMHLADKIAIQFRNGLQISGHPRHVSVKKNIEKGDPLRDTALRGRTSGSQAVRGRGRSNRGKSHFIPNNGRGQGSHAGNFTDNHLGWGVNQHVWGPNHAFGQPLYYQ